MQPRPASSTNTRTPAGRLILPIAAVAALALVLASAGCAKNGDTSMTPLPASINGREDLPSYAELVERYNANLQRLDRMWATTVVALRYKDENDRWQREQGEGHFIFISPDRVALTVGKVGNTILWAGSNEERFWLLDLRKDGIAHVGLRENLGRACSQPLPLPVTPDVVPYLLGLLPLDSQVGPLGGAVQLVDGHYVIEPTGLNLRIKLNVDTALPMQVDLLDPQGQTVIVSELSQHRRVQVEGLALGPRVATRVQISVVDEDARMNIAMADMNDGRRHNTIRDRTFDYDHLIRVHKPAEIRQLDADCP